MASPSPASSPTSSPPESPLLRVLMKRAAAPQESSIEKRMRKPAPGKPPHVEVGAEPSGGIDSCTYFDEGIFWQYAWDKSIPGHGTPSFYCRKYMPDNKAWVNNDVFYYKTYTAPSRAATIAQ